MADNKIFKVDKFLGINQLADSETELKPGEASRIENFTITDGYNLRRRPGVRVKERIQLGKILGLYSGHMNGEKWYCRALFDGKQAQLFLEYKTKEGSTAWSLDVIPDVSDLHPVKVFCMGDSLWMVGRNAYASEPKIARLHWNDGAPDFGGGDVYTPLAFTGMSPAGDGEELERVNILTDSFRVQYSADGQATGFVLPENVVSVLSVQVDNAEATGSYEESNHTFTFASAPAKGVNNVEFTCRYQDEDIALAREKFFRMKHAEAYNGDTDTRLFFYGDGSNISYYTQTPAFGAGLYIPLGNELAADFSASAITGMVRHYSKLIGFQEDGAFTVSYAPVTLADGRVIAGFYLRPLSREIGNQMDGQICTVNNYPRTLCGGTFYEWRNASNYLADERYAKAVSEKVVKLLINADPSRVVTCEDNAGKTYYMFLNDDEGTVLVNRYDMDIWTVYKAEAFRNVLFATCLDGEVTFASDSTVFVFDDSQDYDEAADPEGERQQINAVWESGYMAFGADHRRKYSSRIWLSVLPEAGSSLDVTVETDKRCDYLVKSAGYSLLGFGSIDFSNFTFSTWHAPKIQRIQIKVKKFVYYKLILRVTKPGARATVLGYDQQVRFSSNVK